MNWVCPVCGADDNEESSIRCSCGFILEEKDRNSLTWVDSKMPPNPPLAPNVPFGERTLKYKVGHFLYVLSVIALLAIALMSLATKRLPSKRSFASIVSTCVLVNTISSLLTDDIGIKGVGPVRRSDSPTWFWLQFAFQSLLTVALMMIAVFADD